MKINHSIFIILFTTFFITFILLVTEHDFNKKSQYFHTASAKETGIAKHNTISDAFVLSVNQSYKRKLSPYDTFYGYITSSQNIKIQIHSNVVQKLKITLLSDNGKELSSHESVSGNNRIFTFSKKDAIRSQRIFLRIYNYSPKNISYQIELQNGNSSISNFQKNNANKNNSLKKSSSITATTIQPTSNPKKLFSTKKKLSTNPVKKVVLNPQFLLLKPNSTHDFNLKTEKRKFNLSKYTIINSNSSVAMLKNNKIHAIKEGISIIYLRNKQNSAITYSCFIRVLKE